MSWKSNKQSFVSLSIAFRSIATAFYWFSVHKISLPEWQTTCNKASYLEGENYYGTLLMRRKSNHCVCVHVCMGHFMLPLSLFFDISIWLWVRWRNLWFVIKKFCIMIFPFVYRPVRCHKFNSINWYMCCNNHHNLTLFMSDILTCLCARIQTYK